MCNGNAGWNLPNGNILLVTIWFSAEENILLWINVKRCLDRSSKIFPKQICESVKFLKIERI